MVLPTAAERSKLDEALGDLIGYLSSSSRVVRCILKPDNWGRAIEAHELWNPLTPAPTLYWVWDFVKRSKYMLSEFENIQHGRPLQHPDQFRPAPGMPSKLFCYGAAFLPASFISCADQNSQFLHTRDNLVSLIS